MSLRVFHMVFVIVSVVLSLGVTLWGIREFAQERNQMALMLAALFFVTALALIVYGRKVFVKLKELP